MRTIHYGIRFAIVVMLAAGFYLGLSLLFRQGVQVPGLVTVLIVALGAERLWVFLEWIGPVAGTMNKKKLELEQKQIVEYLLECSLRYASPVAIAAVRSKKRLSLHVVARFFRKSDIVLRSASGYLLALMPFTTLEQAAVPLKRLAARLAVKDVVVTDVSILQLLVEAQRAHNHSEASVTTARELRSMCFQAFDARFANMQASEEQSRVGKGDSGAVIYDLYEPGSQDALFEWIGTLSEVGAEEEAVTDEKQEGAAIASH